jgi:AcrR family transcriptional regulator
MDIQLQPAKRPRGRPQVRCDDDTKSVIIDAANEQFKHAGFASANMTAIARAAGVSTKTLYRLFPAKDDLFSELVERKIGIFLIGIDDHSLEGLAPREGLERLLIAYGRLTLSLDTIAITRLVISESGRFPELAAVFFQKAIVRTSKAMEKWLTAQCDHKSIALDDIPMATGMLRGMMTMEPQRAVMLGRRGEVSDDEIVARARACSKLFLDGCATK